MSLRTSKVGDFGIGLALGEGERREKPALKKKEPGSAYLVGSGADWSFQWSTAGGGGGSIALFGNKKNSTEAMVSEQIAKGITIADRSLAAYNAEFRTPKITVDPLIYNGWEWPFVDVPVNSTYSLTDIAPVQDFSGFWGGARYIWTGGNIDGWRYHYNGQVAGLSPRMGTAPTPGMGKLHSAAKYGRAMHRAYNPGSNYVLNKAIPGSGLRPDAVDYVNKIIRELKPNNPAAISKGWRQLNRYVKELEKQFGPGWKKFLDTY